MNTSFHTKEELTGPSGNLLVWEDCRDIRIATPCSRDCVEPVTIHVSSPCPSLVIEDYRTTAAGIDANTTFPSSPSREKPMPERSRSCPHNRQSQHPMPKQESKSSRNAGARSSPRMLSSGRVATKNSQTRVVVAAPPPVRTAPMPSKTLDTGKETNRCDSNSIIAPGTQAEQIAALQTPSAEIRHSRAAGRPPPKLAGETLDGSLRVPSSSSTSPAERKQEVAKAFDSLNAAPPPPGGWPKALQNVEQMGLRRFTKAQQSLHARAIKEIYAGKKSSCWMWFCFPTPPYMVNGKEAGSARNRMYAIRTDAEARDFLKFEADGVNLRDNYYEACAATRDQLRAGITAKAIFGFIDDPKLRSSVKYFELITRQGVDDALNCLVREIMVLINEKPDETCPEFEFFKSTMPPLLKPRQSVTPAKTTAKTRIGTPSKAPRVLSTPTKNRSAPPRALRAPSAPNR